MEMVTEMATEMVTQMERADENVDGNGNTDADETCEVDSGQAERIVSSI